MAITIAGQEVLILAPLLFGLFISLIELIFIHGDELGANWLKHGFHAIPPALIFVFINMNTGFVVSFIPIAFFKTTMGLLVVRVIIGIIAMIKIKFAAAIMRGSSYGEHLPHVIIIGALIIAAPYIWELFLGAILSPMLPF